MQLFEVVEAKLDESTSFEIVPNLSSAAGVLDNETFALDRSSILIEAGVRYDDPATIDLMESVIKHLPEKRLFVGIWGGSAEWAARVAAWLDDGSERIYWQHRIPPDPNVDARMVWETGYNPLLEIE